MLMLMLTCDEHEWVSELFVLDVCNLNVIILSFIKCCILEFLLSIKVGNLSFVFPSILFRLPFIFQNTHLTILLPIREVFHCYETEYKRNIALCSNRSQHYTEIRLLVIKIMNFMRIRHSLV